MPVACQQIISRAHGSTTVEFWSAPGKLVNNRINDIPCGKHFIPPHEQSLVAARGIHQQAFIGIGKPFIERIIKAEIEFRGKQAHAARARLF